MTRLIEDWIIDIRYNMNSLENDLKMKTNMGYVELAAKSCGNEIQGFSRFVESASIAVIPVTTGQGVIGSFTDSVCSILSYMGFQAFITEGTDVNGLYEAFMKGVDIVFMADDDRFIAINRKNGSVSDNIIATARGFVVAAEGFWGGIEDKDVLLAGYGNVGKEMFGMIKSKKAKVFVYEQDLKKHERILEEGGILVDRDEIKRFKYVLDATNTGNWLSTDLIKDDAAIVSPGVPISLNASSYELHGKRMIHDYLPIGVAVMAGMVYR
ncbi:pyrrolysine biosynthesis protein PylD [Dethiosulfatibacter aminovorans DSM 17477]|uniref:Pyrrolysine biosynthesis protein PylD n=1 Tax=Dethiosulfatibacter aminovorans DSM 17477 TaxID=1121476 RepID=A0A1M6F4J1_9FIRM|nr:3-methylornithyl-N6-L-lysine dehydrogenase PylD [Dethiosulfatibacter aminovorans]SHI92519.1 pyrrolysine biosynthesis protein PylD [Dethiosulfatibacter aminovorans DSM 17477]